MRSTQDFSYLVQKGKTTWKFPARNIGSEKVLLVSMCKFAWVAFFAPWVRSE